MKTFYLWTLEKSRHPKAGAWLFFVSLLESFIFPIPPDVMLAPMALAQRNKALYFAFLCTAGALVGALVGYAIGYFFFDTVGQKLIALMGKENAFRSVQEQFNKYEMLVVLVAAATPIPFKIATISAGFLKGNILTFLLAAAIGRGLRYGLLALFILLFGKQIENFLDKHFTIALSIGVAIFVLGWLALSMI